MVNPFKLIIIGLIAFYAIPAYAEKGFVIEMKSGKETLVKSYSVGTETIDYTSPNGLPGITSKTQVKRILYLEDIKSYTPTLPEKNTGG